MALFDGNSRLFNSWSKGKNRPPFEAAYLYLLALFAGYLISDLAIMSVRPAMLPTQPPPNRPARPPRMTYTDVSKYAQIAQRNVFNQDGKIPQPLTGGANGDVIDAAPVASQLPLKLEGTLVHANPKKSVATITVKSKNEARSVMVDNEIENMARITGIERRKVIFRNLNNNRLEYIDIPKESAVSFGVKEPQTLGAGDVQQKGDFEFTMRRSDINKYTSDLGSILQQARMVPNIIPGSGGRVDGFRFVAIQPGSIYEKLGFKPMDVIKKVNGEDVNSPTKAMELYNALKTENRLQLSVERNGREETFKYDIPD
ncbi:MAG: PDZ domain-containing protein [Bdellovibrionales bacterium]|nr:PDZ domain-containing protein [Bdellovibrionales bacterium]